MVQKEDAKEPKTMKLADPVAATIDPASRQMIERAHELGIETVFDRAVTMKPCNIGTQGTCCKNCGMGPCRLPLPKSGIEGEDTRKGLCGATPNTIAARNFIRMIAGGAAAHSDHGSCVAEVFMSAARKETDAYRIKDLANSYPLPPILMWLPRLRWTESSWTGISTKSRLRWQKKRSMNGAKPKESLLI